MTIATYLDARRSAVSALSAQPADPPAAANDLDAAADALTGSVAAGDTGAPAIAIRAYADALRCLAELERWESDTLAAVPDAERHRRAAELRAKRAAQNLPTADPLCDPLHGALTAIVAACEPEAHRALRAELLAVALPVPLIKSARAVTAPSAGGTSDEPKVAPRAAIVTLIADGPVTYSQAVTPGQVHDLEVEARVLDWPEGYDRLVVRFISRWPRSALDVPEVVIDRPAEPAGGVWTARGAGHLLLNAGAADPLTAIELAINAELIGEAIRRPITVVGQSEITIRTFDSTRDVITGAPVVDLRILDMLAELRQLAIAPGEQPALGRFFGAIARAGVRIIADREFPEGSNPSEADFQAELLKRVAMAPELGGRVAKHAWQGGGPTDLVHDGVVAELKVEKDTPVTLEDASRYLAQATQYASAGQRQLSILAILDMTPMTAAPGVLANTMGWLEPELHGLDDPAFPSRVAVIIIKANLPRPSDWSR